MPGFGPPRSLSPDIIGLADAPPVPTPRSRSAGRDKWMFRSPVRVRAGPSGAYRSFFLLRMAFRPPAFERSDLRGATASLLDDLRVVLPKGMADWFASHATGSPPPNPTRAMAAKSSACSRRVRGRLWRSRLTAATSGYRPLCESAGSRMGGLYCNSDALGQTTEITQSFCRRAGQHCYHTGRFARLGARDGNAANPFVPSTPPVAGYGLKRAAC